MERRAKLRFTAISEKGKRVINGCCTKSDWINVTPRRCGAMHKLQATLPLHYRARPNEQNGTPNSSAPVGQKEIILLRQFGIWVYARIFSSSATLLPASPDRTFDRARVRKISCEQFLHQATRPSAQVQFRLIQAATLQLRQEPQREFNMCKTRSRFTWVRRVVSGNRAVKCAGHTGKYYETREADRAFAYYQDSIDFFCSRSIFPRLTPAL